MSHRRIGFRDAVRPGAPSVRGRQRRHRHRGWPGLRDAGSALPIAVASRARARGVRLDLGCFRAVAPL